MADAAVCAQHTDTPALGTCARCGTFFCALDSRDVDGRRYCESCAARPEVDWLERYRLSLWGRRDGWAWLFGLAAPLQLAVASFVLIESREPVVGALTAGAAICSALWWLGKPAARIGMVLVFALQALYASAQYGPAALMGFVLPSIILIAVVRNPRTRLFFKLDVTAEQLKRMWNLYANNNVARMGLTLGLAGLLIWPFAPLALICGVIGLTRVDPRATPPIGRRGSAIGAIVCGAAGTLALGTFVVSQLI
jgi:hypothetical protein